MAQRCTLQASPESLQNHRGPGLIRQLTAARYAVASEKFQMMWQIGSVGNVLKVGTIAWRAALLQVPSQITSSREACEEATARVTAKQGNMRGSDCQGDGQAGKHARKRLPG